MMKSMHASGMCDIVNAFRQIPWDFVPASCMQKRQVADLHVVLAIAMEKVAHGL